MGTLTQSAFAADGTWGLSAFLADYLAGVPWERCGIRLAQGVAEPTAPPPPSVVALLGDEPSSLVTVAILRLQGMIDLVALRTGRTVDEDIALTPPVARVAVGVFGANDPAEQPMSAMILERVGSVLDSTNIDDGAQLVSFPNADRIGAAAVLALGFSLPHALAGLPPLAISDLAMDALANAGERSFFQGALERRAVATLARIDTVESWTFVALALAAEPKSTPRGVPFTFEVAQSLFRNSSLGTREHKWAGLGRAREFLRRFAQHAPTQNERKLAEQGEALAAALR